MSRRSLARDKCTASLRTAEGARALRIDGADSCGLARRDCPHRAACRRQAERLALARAGSRVDFDAAYDRYFALFYRAVAVRRAPRELVEARTRALLEAAFASPSPSRDCSSAHLFRFVKRLGAAWTRLARARSNAPIRERLTAVCSTARTAPTEPEYRDGLRDPSDASFGAER